MNRYKIENFMLWLIAVVGFGFAGKSLISLSFHAIAGFTLTLLWYRANDAAPKMNTIKEVMQETQLVKGRYEK